MLGVTIPPLKHFGPLLVVWGAAMLMLVFIRDLGSSLMFFGAFLALLYVATGRASFVVAGLALFVAGAWFFAGTVGHVQERIDIWLDPWQDPNDTGFQIAQSLFAQADGGLFGQGFGQALLELPGGAQIPPAPDTDLIYAVITNEVGLFGAAGVVITYLLFAERGFRIAILSEDGFSKLLAAGLTAVFALQAFVIVGGVTRVIPLTGVTLPFVSYGGSSIVANFVLLALLLMVSEQARAPAGAVRSPVVERISSTPNPGATPRRCRAREHPHPQPVRPGRAAVRGADRLHVLLVGVRRRRAGGQPGQQAAAARGAADPARADPRGRRHRARPQPRQRATRHGSTSASIPRALSSAIPWVTTSWSAGESGSSGSTTTT